MRLFTALLVLVGSVASSVPAGTYTPPPTNYYAPSKVEYTFRGWPSGGRDSMRFTSALYAKDSVSYVYLGGIFLFSMDESLKRYPDDFDSLKAMVITKHLLPVNPQTVYTGGANFTYENYSYDTTWIPAVRAGRMWAFPKVTGRVSLFASEPEGEVLTLMDTGSGLVKYSESAFRMKISESPRAAGILRTEKIARATSWGMLLGGGVLAAVGFGSSEERVDAEGDPDGRLKFSPLIFVGLGVFIGSWIPHFIAKGKYEQAIKAYNEDALKGVPLVPKPTGIESPAVER